MTRQQTALVSTVAAVPAALLVVMVVMVYLNYMEGLKNPLIHVVLGLTAVTAVCVAATPVALLMPPRKKADAATKDTEPGETVVVDRGSGDISVADAEISESDDTEVAETVDFDSGQVQSKIDEFDELNEVEELAESTDELDDSAVFLDDEEEDPKPKKKR